MVAAIGAAAAIGGSMISANATKKAANQQSAAADRAAELQREQQMQMREDLAPWVQTGRGANDLLAQYLGIRGGGAGGGKFYTEQELRDQLSSQFTTTTPGAQSKGGVIPVTITPNDPRWDWNQPWSQDGPEGGQRTQVVMQPVSSVGPGSSTVDQAGLDAEVKRRLAEQSLAQQAYENDPNFGSLLRAYRNGEEFSFTGKDLENDPGYQFGLNQGELGINRGQASRGNFLSGAAMKELARFNEDYAGTKFNDAFSRNLNTWNTNLNAYNDNRNRIYNFLSGTSSAGQNAATQVGNNSQQVSNNVGNALMGGANASAAGTIGTANALQSGINQAYNAYAGQNPSNAQGWNSLLSSQGGGYSGYTGYTGGGNDPIANLNTSKGWTG